ncbi:hypothetical protein C8R45DRAFT_935665 [Mycena sanguinolenta]|nr:hypothetical protein C8R45DRAFT_935665 [Mycena sanguinolenta]
MTNFEAKNGGFHRGPMESSGTMNQWNPVVSTGIHQIPLGSIFAALANVEHRRSTMPTNGNQPFVSSACITASGTSRASLMVLMGMMGAAALSSATFPLTFDVRDTAEWLPREDGPRLACSISVKP